MIENVETGFTSDEYDTSRLENGTNDVVQFEQMTVTLTTPENQKKDKENPNVTTVDLGECEQLLRMKLLIYFSKKSRKKILN